MYKEFENRFLSYVFKDVTNFEEKLFTPEQKSNMQNLTNDETEAKVLRCYLFA